MAEDQHSEIQGVGLAAPPNLKSPASPDLEGILGRFSDALDILKVSTAALSTHEDMTSEWCVLGLAFEKLNQVYNELDAATGQLAQS